MAITNATVVPIIYAAQLYRIYRTKTVYADLCDRRYQGLLQNGGDRVRISKINDAPAIADYAANQASAITYTAADATAIGDILLDKFKYWALKVDDIHAFISSVDLLSASVETAGEILARQVDSDVLTEMTSTVGNAQTGGAKVGLPAFTLDHEVSGGLDVSALKLPQLHRVLDIANVPREGRFLVIGPYTAEIFQQVALDKTVLAAPYNSETRNGRIGNYAGFEIIVTSKQGDVASNATDETWLYGNRTACAIIEEMRRVENIRLQTHFQDAIRGLFGYGVQMIDNSRLNKTVVTIDNIPGT